MLNVASDKREPLDGALQIILPDGTEDEFREFQVGKSEYNILCWVLGRNIRRKHGISEKIHSKYLCFIRDCQKIDPNFQLLL